MTSELHLGGLRLVAIEDGWFFPNAVDTIRGWDWDEVEADVPGAQLDGTLRFSLGCFLIEGPFGLVLIDTGAGPDDRSPDRFTSGRLPGALSDIGVTTDDIVAIIHTHLHFDHWGGDFDSSGDVAYANARILVDRSEMTYWEDKDPVASGFGALVSDGRVDLVGANAAPFPGVTLVPTPGHTPGHVSVEIAGDTEQALVLGDVAHHPEQLRHPRWGVRFDVDGTKAAETRQSVFDRLADRQEVLAGGHWPRPGLGRVVTRGGRRSLEAL